MRKTVPIRWNKNGDKWTNGKRKIQKSLRSYEQEESGGRHYRPYNPDLKEVYHAYEDGKYIGQSDTLDGVKEKHEKDKEKEN